MNASLGVVLHGVYQGRIRAAGVSAAVAGTTLSAGGKTSATPLLLQVAQGAESKKPDEARRRVFSALDALA